MFNNNFLVLIDIFKTLPILMFIKKSQTLEKKYNFLSVTFLWTSQDNSPKIKIKNVKICYTKYVLRNLSN